ncbi:MAG: hypothetical protein LIQ31_02305 [Planctomycetes bacterium]|nr:hypothetical protein [Planctomycetota bacterium]
MADTPDTPQQGRMLFTDMDILDKERSAVGVADDVAPYVAPSLISLDDIAANIDLDFEDDDVPAGRSADASRPDPTSTDQPGDAPAAPSVPAGSDPGATADDDAVPDTDAVLSLDDTAPAIPYTSPATFGPAALDAFPEIPTWEDFTKAFRQGDKAAATRPITNLLTGLPAEAEQFFNPPDPVEPVVPDDKQAEDNGEAGQDEFMDSIDALLDGEDIDILSILSQPPAPDGAGDSSDWAEAADADDSTGAPRRRTTTVVVPPPPVPYGGIERVEDWYVPPEDERVFTMPTDWYEPPEEIRENAGSGGDETPVTAEEKAKRESSRRERRRESTRHRPVGHDTAAGLDMFSDFDLDEVWQERVKTGGTTSPDTRSLDLFDGLDIEELWEQRSAAGDIGSFDHAGGFNPEELRDQYADLSAGDTIILETNRPEAEDTVILPGDTLQSRQAPGIDTGRYTRPNNEDEAAALLDELDSIGESDDEDRSADDDGAEAGAARRPGKRTPRRAASDDITFGDPRRARDRSGAASEDDAPRRPRRARPKASAAGALVDGDGPDPTAVDGPDIDYGGDDTDPGALGEAGAADGADGDDALPPDEEFGLTTDDLLDEGFDDLPGINADLSAPVIDDSAITDMDGPKPGTEEMEAIMERHLARENGEDDDGDPLAGIREGGDGGDEAGQGEEEEEAVAVNPMDVFANMDDMDFSDDMDDEMRAMMDDEEEAEGGAEGEGDAAGAAETAAMVAPKGIIGKATFTLSRLIRRVLPAGLLERLQLMIAWRENWWFYCDLVAAIIASASLAVIISYYIWYRN